MKPASILLVLVAVAMGRSLANDLIVGTTYNARLLHQEKSEYVALPFLKRVKAFFYSDPAQTPIRGIIARDVDHTEAIASITAGGVGSPFVNIRLKSPRGSGLNYQIEIYG